MMHYKGHLSETQDELAETRKYLDDTQKQLKKIKKEHKELESLTVWMQEYCLSKKAMFCGIVKIHMEIATHYLGFALESEDVNERQRTYKYLLRGFLSNAYGDPTPEYVADLHQDFSEIILDDITNKLVLQDQHVLHDVYKRKGIGSAAMTVVKDLAKQLHCDVITGRRVPQGDTKEEADHLWDFYEKNNFEQHPDSEWIRFQLKEYRSED